MVYFLYNEVVTLWNIMYVHETAEDFLKYLINKSKEGKFTIVLDEFQRFLDIAPEMISALQNYWDSVFL